MVATKGAITLDEIAFQLPYAQGLQFIWDAKLANGEMIKAANPTRETTSERRKQEIRNLLG